MEAVRQRQRGLLAVESVEVVGGSRYFQCRCECGRRRRVLASSYHGGSVRGCADCVRRGLASAEPRRLRRVYLTLDPEVLAVLGLAAEVTGAGLRQWLRDQATERSGDSGD